MFRIALCFHSLTTTQPLSQAINNRGRYHHSIPLVVSRDNPLTFQEDEHSTPPLGESLASLQQPTVRGHPAYTGDFARTASPSTDSPLGTLRGAPLHGTLRLSATRNFSCLSKRFGVNSNQRILLNDPRFLLWGCNQC